MIAGLRMLNAATKRKPYLLPRLQDIFWRRRGYSYMTKLDLTMQYYCFELDEDSKNLCVIVSPWGKYRYEVLPMGLTNSPDWAQSAMEQLFDDMRHDIECYLDDIGIFDTDWKNHIAKLEQVLHRLQSNGFTVNPLKCEWAVKETDWLGYYITPTGLRPWKKKIEAIVNMAKPTTVKQLRSFIGMVNFYCTMWKRRADIMAPLTALTKLKKGSIVAKWTSEHDAAFEKTKAIICEEVLLAYPDPNKPFVIQTDASNKQLGAVILQDNKPVAFFSRKLTGPQSRYPIPDKEALSIVETLQEFRPLLFGAQIIIRTDHKNLTQPHFKSHRLYSWRLLIEEFAPTIEYIPGEHNIGADTLSRYPLREEVQVLDSDELSHKLQEIMLYYPQEINAFPLDFENIRREQQADATCLQLLNQEGFETQEFYGTLLICKHNDNQWKIVIPESLIDDTIKWYHYITAHAGVDRLYKTITAVFYFKGLKEKIVDFVRLCDTCQCNKNPGMSNVELPPRNATELPWETVAVDLIGPWKVDIPGVGLLTFRALTIIDICTTLSEVTRIEEATSPHVAMKFENEWLSRYPKPVVCIHDPGREFVGMTFQTMIIKNGIQPQPTTVKNPQANAVCERMHSTIGDMLRSMLHENPPTNLQTALDMVDSVIASAQYALRTATHRAFNTSPGALVFGRDMLLPIPMLIDWATLRARRQAIIDDNNRRENLRRRFRDYKVGEEVLLLTYKPDKLEPRATGPFQIDEVHVNGTVTIRRNNNVLERVNVRRLRPYYRRL